MSQMPDKIWLHKDTKYNTGDIVSAYQYEFAQEIECEGSENFVEYVPKDAFIEKACQFIKEHHHEFSFWNTEEYELGFSTQKFIEDFKKYMEE